MCIHLWKRNAWPPSYYSPNDPERAAVSSGPAALAINQEVGSFELSKAGIKPGKCLCAQEAKKGHRKTKWAVAVHSSPFAFQNQCPGFREVLLPNTPTLFQGPGSCLWPLDSTLSEKSDVAEVLHQMLITSRSWRRQSHTDQCCQQVWPWLDAPHVLHLSHLLGCRALHCDWLNESDVTCLNFRHGQCSHWCGAGAVRLSS